MCVRRLEIVKYMTSQKRYRMSAIARVEVELGTIIIISTELQRTADGRAQTDPGRTPLYAL